MAPYSLVRSRLAGMFAVGFAMLSACEIQAQDRIKTMPGYERYTEMSKKIPGSVKPGTLTTRWADGGKSLEFRKAGKVRRMDLETRKTTEIEAFGESKAEAGGRFHGGPGRGRQVEAETSPDGTLKAFHRARDLWLSDPKGVIETRITVDGSESKRIKNGTASWVYGEELEQNRAIWWSPDSKRVAFYRFDEGKVVDYFLGLDQLDLQSRVGAEPYPKAGSPNPVADLLVYDTEAKTTSTIDVRGGQPFGDDVVGHYVYRVAWSPDGAELLFNRTNRHQNILEFVAANPRSGVVRMIVREEWPASWVENSPPLRFLEGGKEFLWISERNGYRNIYRYNLLGELLAVVTDHEFEVASIERVDEKAGVVHYLARSGDNPLKLQLHRAMLDGSGDVRLTDPKWHHDVDMAPDGRHFLDVAQSHDTPPATSLLDSEGKVLETLAVSETTAFETLGLKRVELLTFKAADGETDLYGLLHFPSDFDPSRRYPLLVSVYAGPATNGARETFSTPSTLTEYGFLVASFDSRSAAGRGKKFLDAIYRKLGTVEIDDQAAGVRSLWARPYVDKDRVGIFGTSYGGYATLMALIRHPGVFRAGCAMSAVTDFRNYDTIYTERYLRTPQEDAAGYDGGSAVKQAEKVKGDLMIYFGTADDNVHPSNALQMIRALNQAGKSYEVQIGPDQGHTALSGGRMMEFFIEHLIIDPRR
jgi:dipeptidyl-peptidase-4